MLKSGHRTVPVTGKEHDEVIKVVKLYEIGTFRLEPGGWFYTTPFLLFADHIYDFKFKPSDVIVMTFSKSGTTWAQEIVWTMMNNPELNNPRASLPVSERSLQMDSDIVLEMLKLLKLDHEFAFNDGLKRVSEKDFKDCVTLQSLEVEPDPRTIKTHLPFSLHNPATLDTCKVIYVARNPKDTVVSYHHHMRLHEGYGFDGTLEDTVNLIIDNRAYYGPYWQHMKEAWVRRDHPNLHFVYFEDLKENPKKEIIRIQNFLNLELTPQQINNIVEYTSFPAMKARDNNSRELNKETKTENPTLNVKYMEKEGGFFRKGIVGDWKNQLTADQVNRIDEWTKKNVEAFGPDFRYRI